MKTCPAGYHTAMAEPDSAGRRANRRGLATRETLLEAAVKALASGEPVSANRIAKQLGVTWGTIQYQFGDTDGFWAAVMHFTAERRGNLFGKSKTSRTLRGRVAGIIDTLYDGLTATDSLAIENLRAALPRDYTELERLYPRTAAEFYSWGQSWQETCQLAFADLHVDPQRVREVASFIPGAMRGITSERQLGTYADLDEARRGLTNAIVSYLNDGRAGR
jgi:AcrR family transcriptional regulator